MCINCLMLASKSRCDVTLYLQDKKNLFPAQSKIRHGFLSFCLSFDLLLKRPKYCFLVDLNVMIQNKGFGSTIRYILIKYIFRWVQAYKFRWDEASFNHPREEISRTFGHVRKTMRINMSSETYIQRNSCLIISGIVRFTDKVYFTSNVGLTTFVRSIFLPGKHAQNQVFIKIKVRHFSRFKPEFQCVQKFE